MQSYSEDNLGSVSDVKKSKSEGFVSRIDPDEDIKFELDSDLSIDAKLFAQGMDQVISEKAKPIEERDFDFQRHLLV